MGRNSLWNKALIISVCFHLGIVPCIGLVLNNYLTAPSIEKPIELELVMSVSAQTTDTGNLVQQTEKINHPPRPEQKIPDNTPQPIKKEPVNKQKTETIAKDPEAVIDRNIETNFENSDKNPVNGNDNQAESDTSSQNTSSPNGNGGQSGKSGGYIRPQLLNKIDPVYPEKARTASREGIVYVSLEVLSNGKVGSVTIKQSSGHTDLDNAAVKAVKRWRFVPAKDSLNGQAITCLVNFPVVFQLK